MDLHGLSFHGGGLPRLELPQPSGTPQIWLLRPGINRIGSDPANDICLDAPGVSARHCEIVVGDQACTLIDLNSTQGTWLNDRQIQTAALRDGDCITVGTVTFRFLWGARARVKLRLRTADPRPAAAQAAAPDIPESPPASAPNKDSAAAPPLPPPVSAPATATQAVCAQHPSVPAQYSCPRCRSYYCDVCVGISDAGATATAWCPVCRVACLPVPSPVPVSAPHGSEWLRAWWQTFSYPASLEGLAVLAAGAVLLWLLQIASAFSGIVPIIGGLIYVFLTLVWVGMTFSFLQSVIRQTALGSDRMPDLPDIGNLAEDLGTPLWQFLCLLVFAMPALVLSVLGETAASWPRWIWIVAWAWTAFYLPMGLLALSFFKTIRALDPRVVVRSIVRAGPLYLACVLWLASLAGVAWAVMALVGLVPVGVLALLLQDFVLLYALLCAGRVLGLLYRFRQEDLRWVVG
ncbi:MAG: FHA domain-containing protein [Limisphaera sp.]|nr:FHA domain-containing protein [Limisphaera sp.]